jgi:hypothetical protein
VVLAQYLQSLSYWLAAMTGTAGRATSAAAAAAAGAFGHGVGLGNMLQGLRRGLLDAVLPALKDRETSARDDGAAKRTKYGSAPSRSQQQQLQG